MKTLAALLVLVASFASAEIKGQVTVAIPLPVGNGLSVDFSLMQNIGGTDANFFTYKELKSGKPFTLSYGSGHWLWAPASFVGEVTQTYSPVTFPNGCMLFSADLIGTWTLEGHVDYDLEAFYSQFICTQGGATRYAAGDFSILVPPRGDKPWRDILKEHDLYGKWGIY